jgi:diadenosine tetraphosphate (Ap4A) HIT family hydrolase
MTRVALLLLVALSATAYAQSVVVYNFTALVDVAVVVSNFTVIVDVAKPDFVMDVEGCSVYVYVVRDFETAKTPLLHTGVPKTRMPASPTDSEEILDAFIKALGPRLTAYVTIIKPEGGSERRAVEVSIRHSTELRRAIERALGVDLAKNYVEASSAVIKTQRPTAYPDSLAIEMKDTQVYLFFLSGGNGSKFFQVEKLVIEATRWEKAFEILSRIGEAAGGRTPPAYIYIVPCWADDEEGRKLVKAAETLERELGTVREFPDGVEGIIHIMRYGHVGPYMLVFPYPNGSAPPDRVTAEKVVRRFVELAGVCRSPMVVEFWPKTGYERATGRRDQTPLFLAVAAGAAAVATAAVLILKKRRTN